MSGENEMHFCQAHSGIDSRQNLLLWLLGILCAIGVTSIGMLTTIRSDVAVVQAKLIEMDRRYVSMERFIILEREVMEIRTCLSDGRTR